jgi:hypothetical protein
MSVSQYWEEISAFTLLCIAFLCLKIYVCCHGLGLAQNHKQPENRLGLNAKTSYNCQDTGRIILRANERFALKNTPQASDSLVEDPAELNPADLIPLKHVRFQKQSQIYAVKTYADQSV